uniref:T9SS type B sorting domain-containing protein n=1 Tax=Aquiflexum sp. TaxID=1872584 RepID=UPI0035943147
YGGVLGNILNNDILNGNPVNFEDVNFEFTELAGIIGLLINENGELSLIPGLNPAGEYVLSYELREAANPTNEDVATVTFKLLVNDVDLSITKTSNGLEIFEGDEFFYEIMVNNIGGTDARNVVIVDDLPNAVSYLGSSFEPSDPQMEVDVRVSGAAVTYIVPFFPTDASLMIRIKVRANEINSDRVVQVTNIATVSSDEDDTNLADNQASDSNQINPFFIPNVITPDGDGLNDRFEIKGLDKFVENEIVIFNRNGDHVYEKKNYQNEWAADGLVSGTYFFVLKAVDRQGKPHEFKGWIQVIKK